MNKNDVLTVKNLTKIFPPNNKTGKPFCAVDNISFSLKEGEVLGLLGPNGAGKSTTIYMLLGVLTATSGTITAFGKDFFTSRSEVLQNIGFASTYINFPTNLTVRENLIIHGRLYGLSGALLKSRIDNYLEIFKAQAFSGREVGTLSAGQKTKIMLIKAFMTEPKILLLDEPTASFDPDVAHEVRQFIIDEQKRRGFSVLFTSHNMDEVAAVCGRVLVLQNGKILACDAPSVLASSISKARVQLIISDGLKRLLSLVNEQKFSHRIRERWIEVEVNERDVALFLETIVQNGIQFSHIAIEKPSLEDYFLQVARKNQESRSDS